MKESPRASNCCANGPRIEHRPYFLLFGQNWEFVIEVNSSKKKTELSHNTLAFGNVSITCFFRRNMEIIEISDQPGNSFCQILASYLQKNSGNDPKSAVEKQGYFNVKQHNSIGVRKLLYWLLRQKLQNRANFSCFKMFSHKLDLNVQNYA